MKIFTAAGLSGKKPGELASLSLIALGVVYGDIGTSPLYAVRACFFSPSGVAPTEGNVLGVLSLIFWSLMVVISIKYVIFVLRADYDGEGGILALTELVRKRTKGWTRKAVLTTGFFGAALLYGDGIITPAISVLSAIEGIEVAAPLSHSLVVPMTVAVLAMLFLLQRYGTGGVGRLFGPIVLVWFITLAATGAAAVARQPLVLQAVNPWHGAAFFLHNGTAAFTVLGFVFLVVTGGEALYADIGHFGTAPIRLGWYTSSSPACS